VLYRQAVANKLEELRVYQSAVNFSESVTALLGRLEHRRYRDLREQIDDANGSITANISEGFEQPTDAAFVQYLFHAKASLAEVLTRLREVRSKGCISKKELADRLEAGETLSRSLAAFIRYLDSCGWKDRGRYKSRKRREQATKRRGERQGTNDPGTNDPGTNDPGTNDPGTEGPGTRNSRPY
jgi:four helix bundle protein